MTTIRHKRGLEASLIALNEAEFGFTTDQKNIYIGSSSGNIKMAKYSDVTSVSGTLSTHTSNSQIHITSTERTNWNAKYAKPSTGIPSTDLAEAVRTSLGKADTAIQSIPNATSSVLGGVKVGTNIAVSSGVISVADGTTSAKGLVQLSTATNSTSTALAATPSAVKSAYDLASGKYSKPSTGIPKTDLASDVQASLTKADNAENNAKAYTNTKIAELVNSAPEALDTLGELAEAIQANETAYDGLLEVIGNKADSGDMSGHATNTTIHITSAERTAWNAKYTKPSAGILKADLASTVQDSLGKADSALQSSSTLDATKLSGTATISTSGNAGTATKLATARTISLSGGVTGSASFNGSSDISIATTVASHTHTIANIDSLQATLNGKASTAVATTSANGLMSSTDKSKLDGIASGANNVTKTSQLTNDSGFETTTGAQSKANTALTSAQNWVKGFGLGGTAASISSTNLNDLSNTGFYMGSSLTNAPTTTTSDWYFIVNIKHNDLYRVQLAYLFNTNNGQIEYKRACLNGVWGAWVQQEDTAGSQNKVNTHANDTTKHITASERTAWNAKANNASPGLTGTPTAPTAAAGTNTTQLATTAFVTTAVNNKTSVSGNAGSATKLQTARTINGVSFDGTANITIADSTKLPSGGTAVAANKLATARTIDGISFDGTVAVSSYGTSSTDAATAAKVATVSSSLSLVAGARVAIKFTTANSASSPTLNVNSLGAKPIWFRGAALTSSLFYWAANQIVEFVYDGTNWNMIGAPNNQNNTYSTLKNPYAISINGTSYDGSAAVSITGLATQAYVQEQITALRNEVIAAIVGTSS